jgi:ATP-dependent helicase/nuclease subunit A
MSEAQSPLSVVLPDSPDPNIPQRAASEPEAIAWVSASAGSGKTKVLTDRVLRLLLPDPQGRWTGAAPHRLLCITFTKAGAAEMSLRVQKRLGAWAVMPESDLSAELHSLTGQQPSADMIRAARRLFADVLDCPGGLRILTIHSFCQSVLGRFPLEAGVSPNFTVLDSAPADQLFSQCIDAVLLGAQKGSDKHSDAFDLLAPALDLNELRREVQSVLKRPEELEAALKGMTSLADLNLRIAVGLGLPAGATLEKLFSAFNARIDEPALRQALADLATSNKTDQKIGLGLQLWLDCDAGERARTSDEMLAAVLTKKDGPRKLGKPFERSYPQHVETFARFHLALAEWQDQVLAYRQARLSAALLWLARAILARYEAEKKRQGALDFNDLIRRTDRLLSSSGSAWVHFKLDGGIDHILMDEAQDTNHLQWSIFDHLRQEIFTGSGRESMQPRSVFVVGDEKQSIFGFQGADPAGFHTMKARIARESEAIGRDFRPVQLEVSFRTTPPVLELVDQTFAGPELHARLGIDPQTKLRHFSRRAPEAGLVELWPLEPKVKRDKRDPWTLPFDPPAPEKTTPNLPAQIAQQISFWLQNEKLEATGRRVRPGDILVLVKTRNSFVHELVRQLKRRAIPVSGVDRMILTDQIGVQDLLALARFARLPSDDFSLACVLKSPLVGWDDDRLMHYAIPRAHTLWEALEETGPPDVKSWLDRLITGARSLSPFEFFETALNLACPAAASGWRGMTARLGEDVTDPLNELLSLCLQLETQGVRTLDDLQVWAQKNKVEIKREMDEGGHAEDGGQVRIMTVHASKGLEAPIVILPDTTSSVARHKIDALIWPSQSGLSVPVWSSSPTRGCKAYISAGDRVFARAEDEYARLLYVALTRARDRLYIMGAETSANALARSWYKLVEDAFEVLPHVETLENGRKRLVSTQQETVSQTRTGAESAAPPADIPAWLGKAAPLDPALPKKLTPSRLDEEEGEDGSLPAVQAYSPFDPARPNRVLRGTLTHTLFQFLPDIDEQKREEAARFYLERAGRGLSAALREEIISETLAVLCDPVFAPVFAPGSLAEVPVTGLLSDGRIISGQIDRLVIRDNEILIVDYKTNRPSPVDARNVPNIYRNQLRAYRDALALMHPKSLIKCAILWTDQPVLMSVPI